MNKPQATRGGFSTVYALLPVLVLIFIAEDGLKAAPWSWLRRDGKAEFNIVFEAFSFVLTVLAVVFYLIGTYSTSGFRKMRLDFF